MQLYLMRGQRLQDLTLIILSQLMRDNIPLFVGIAVVHMLLYNGEVGRQDSLRAGLEENDSSVCLLYTLP